MADKQFTITGTGSLVAQARVLVKDYVDLPQFVLAATPA